jgi:Zn finger protein HypA/HybF involved in hydrogenase expression
MKLNKIWKKTEDRTAGVHFCKKCGDELTSTNKDILCDDCRRKKADKIRNLGLTILSITLSGLVVLIKERFDSTNQKS